MIRILCPTDFSEHAKQAVHYAVRLSNDLSAELHLISVYSVPRKTSTFVSMKDDILQVAKEDMEELLAAVTPQINTGYPPISNIYEGRTVDMILGYAKAKEIDLIVMGTQGENSMSNVLLGSVTSKLSAKSPIPVLAIPVDAKYGLSGHNFLLALDDKELKRKETFAFPIAFAQKIGVSIDILHITGADDTDLPFDPFISAYLPNLIGEVVLYKHDDIIDGIKEYAEKNDVGMIIMVRRNRGFFERLFTVGHTAEELAKTNIPVLILEE